MNSYGILFAIVMQDKELYYIKDYFLHDSEVVTHFVNHT